MRKLRRNPKQGTSGSYIYYDKNGKYLFKPIVQECRDLRSNVPGQYCQREILAYKFANLLGLDFVPETKKVKVKIRKRNRIGSAQKWINGKSFNEKYGYDDKAIEEFFFSEKRKQKTLELFLFDIVIFNTDRHTGNIMISGGQFYAIDHGLCFPSSHSDACQDILYEYNKKLFDFLCDGNFKELGKKFSKLTPQLMERLKKVTEKEISSLFPSNMDAECELTWERIAKLTGRD